MSESATLGYDIELDTRGLNCPLPILKTRKALNTMASGQLLHVLATDPGAVVDFAAFTAQTGHALVEEREEAGVYHFVLRKK